MDIVLNQNVTINDPELKKVTSEIKKASANVIGNTFKIAYLISSVDANPDILETDGFNDVFDYTKKCFGLEKASAYNLIRVGKDFIEAVEHGKITSFETLLTHGDKDYSISQVFKMLPLGIEKAKELTADEVITPDMSCRTIEKIVKENTEGTKARGKKKNDDDSNPESFNDEADAIELMIEWDDVPDDVKSWLRNEYELEDVTSIRINVGE